MDTKRDKTWRRVRTLTSEDEEDEEGDGGLVDNDDDVEDSLRENGGV